MKKVLKITGIALLAPVLLVVMLAVLLYIPPVQNWMIGKVAGVASQVTGMQISVGRVELAFPLDLVLSDVLVVRQRDTIASIGHATVDVQLLPLCHKRVVVDQLELHDALVNTVDFISDLQLRGRVGRLSVRSRGIDLNTGTIDLNGARLSDSDITVLLSDTAAVDTTTSETALLITLDSIALERSRVEVHTPGDSMRVSAYMGNTRGTGVTLDLLAGRYAVQSFDWRDGSFTLDQGPLHASPAPVSSASSIDFAHLSLSGIGIGIDSLDFQSPRLSMSIRDAAMRERSGLAITRLQGPVLMDSTTVYLPHLSLSTPYSYIHARGEVDLTIADSVAPGHFDIDLKASLGKQDLLLFIDDPQAQLRSAWPDWPLAITACVDGSLRQCRIKEFDATLPTVAHIASSGTIGIHDALAASLSLDVETYDLSLLSAFVPAMGKDFTAPKGLSLQGKIDTQGTLYAADLTLRDGQSRVEARGHLDERSMSYDADVLIDALDLHRYLPLQKLGFLTATVKANGRGTDLMSKDSRLDGNIHLAHLDYDGLSIDTVQAVAVLKDRKFSAAVEGHNSLFDGVVSTDALLGSNYIKGSVAARLIKADLYAMRLFDNPFTFGLDGDLDIESNFKERHCLSGLLKDIYIKDSVRTYHPENIGVLLRTNAETTKVRLQSGTFITKLDVQGNYEHALSQLSAFSSKLDEQMKSRTIDQQALKVLLPTAKVSVTCRENNPVADILRASSNITFRELVAELDVSPLTGVNGASHIYNLNIDSNYVDTVRVNLVEKKGILTFNGQLTNNKNNPQMVFNTLFDGRLQEHGASIGVRYFDGEGQMGLRIGTQATMVDNGINFRLVPQDPTIGYKKFRLNADNFLLLQRNQRLMANVNMVSDDGTGLKIYSPEQQDSTLLQDLTVTLHQINLGQITEVLPFLPSITGLLDGDFHLTMNQESQVSLVSDMQIAKMTYENSPIGDLATELAYLQRENNTHAVEATLLLDDDEVGSLRGEYQDTNDGQIEGILQLTHFPLDLVNGFISDQIIGFEGFAEGNLAVQGNLTKLDVDGEVNLDSAALVSQPYGIRLRFDEAPVRISDAQLLFDGFKLYAYNNEPLEMTGSLDFRNTERISMDMRMHARNFQLINSKQMSRSVSWGKAYVNVFARLNGLLDQLNMRGRIDVLGTTDLNYMILDSPLSADNQMDELVKFVNLRDSITETISRPHPDGIKADLTISIDQGTHVRCALNVGQTNYVDLYGGGDLHMKYNYEGLSITGRYTIGDGQMKYSLPVIPLKTFTIQEGSYVEFLGDPSNPRLNLTATERVKTAVSEENGQSRSVSFDCGVVITKMLNDMGLSFVINAPNDTYVASELATLTAEERSKVAVTMLTTGLYLSDANTSNFTMNSALNSFLQGEINSIAGSALKTLDVSVGIDNSTDASGTVHTDYSFKFAKRFWNNRLRVQIGGLVSDQAASIDGQQKSFFDNVSMEYRLSPTGNQYVNLFYNQNVYDWIEGYTSEYGGGFIWRRRMDSLLDLFRRSSRRNYRLRLRTDSVRQQRTDSTTTHVLKHE